MIHIIENGVVVNSIVATLGEAQIAFPDATCIEGAGGIGWLWDGHVLTPPPAPEVPAPVPQVVSPAQGLVALYALQGITDADLQAAIDQISDPQQQYVARIGVTRATEWRRDSATTQALAAMLGLGEQDMDALFSYAHEVQV